MVCRDYTKEVGLQSGQKTISKPFAAAILILIAVAGWYVVHASLSAHPARSPQESAIAAK